MTQTIDSGGLTPTLSQKLRAGHLPALDGIRAVAVFLVIFYHAGLPLPGGLGVLIFFVLSGFLITWLLLKEAHRSGTVSLRKFYIRRCLRIFPAFYAYAAVCLIGLILRHKHILWPQVWASLLYVNNYYQGIHGDPNTVFSHTWSLGVEEQFYLLWPTAFLLLTRSRRSLSKVLTASIVFVWLYRLVLVFHVNQGYIYEAFDTRADSLMVGCLLAVLLWQGRLTWFFNWACSSRWLVLLSLALLVASVVLEQRIGAPFRDTIGLGLDSLLVGILIPQLIARRTWLNWRWVSYLGVLSYSLYLWQQLAIAPGEKLAARAPAPFRLPIIVVAVLICAMGSYYIVERPALKLKERFSA